MKMREFGMQPKKLGYLRYAQKVLSLNIFEDLHIHIQKTAS